MTTARDAIRAFRLREGLPVDGGVDKAIDWTSVLGIPAPIPNTSMRRPLVLYHDLHHVVSGYATNEIGESQVSAWTIGTGGGPFFGRLYDLIALLPGLVHNPRACLRAYARGRRGSNLYGAPAASWLDHQLADLRERTGCDQPPQRATLGDAVHFAATVVVAVLASTTVTPVCMLGSVIYDAFALPSGAPARR